MKEERIIEKIENLQKIEREEKELKEKEEEQTKIRWKPVRDLELDYNHSLRFALKAIEISNNAKLMLDAVMLHAKK